MKITKSSDGVSKEKGGARAGDIATDRIIWSGEMRICERDIYYGLV